MLPSKKSARAAGKAKATETAAETPKKKISFKKLARESGSSSSWKAGRRRSNKDSPAVFILVRAKYMKGDKQGEYTGSVYFRGKPRYSAAGNTKFKEALAKHLLTESLRWNDELKLFTARVYTVKQARLLLKEMRGLVDGDKDMPEDIDTAVFDEVDASKYTINVVPIEVDGVPHLALSGATFPFKDELKEKGFTFNTEVNGTEGLAMWVAPTAEIDQEELDLRFTEYGFEVEYCEVDDDDDDDE